MKELRQWISNEVAPSLLPKGRSGISRARFALTLCSRRTIQPGRSGQALRLSRALERQGILTRVDKLLIVTAGSGLVQRWGGSIKQIRSGAVVWFSLGEKHWHGVTPTTAVTHIAIQEQLDGKIVDWLEQVSDEQYQAPNVN